MIAPKLSKIHIQWSSGALKNLLIPFRLNDLRQRYRKSLRYKRIPVHFPHHVRFVVSVIGVSDLQSETVCRGCDLLIQRDKQRNIYLSASISENALSISSRVKAGAKKPTVLLYKKYFPL